MPDSPCRCDPADLELDDLELDETDVLLPCACYLQGWKNGYMEAVLEEMAAEPDEGPESVGPAVGPNPDRATVREA